MKRKMLCFYSFTIYFVLNVVNITHGLPTDNKERHDRNQDEEIEQKVTYRKDLLRYAKAVIKQIDSTDTFVKQLRMSSEEDMVSGRTVGNAFHLITPDVRTKLNEIKQKEIKYQQKKVSHDSPNAKDEEGANWNPINRQNHETFEAEDLILLYSELHNRHEKNKRGKEFKEYEMEKERKRKTKLAQMSEEEKAKEQEREKEQAKTHEKVHEPGHKAQIEEVWEKQDGMDKESFDFKTFFHLHDKNGDGNLDEHEYKTIFLTDLDKVYNESDPNIDLYEREEDMKEMWVYAMNEHDSNKDGLISYDEFVQSTQNEDFEKDKEWKPVIEKENFTPEEFERYKLDRKLTHPKEEGENDIDDEDDFDEE